jgi:hypothetical protein
MTMKKKEKKKKTNLDKFTKLNAVELKQIAGGSFTKYLKDFLSS